MDNTAPNAMHYYDDELHTYLQGSAYTFKFETGTLNTEAEYLAVGNHLAFQHADKDYYLNIMHVEKTEYTASVEAYGLLFELLNEEKDAYKASKAMSFIEYMKIFDSAGSVKIGINEISTYSRMIEWTASEEMLARIYSLATNFDAEVEFITELNKDYSLKQIVMNIYKKHSDTVQGMGTDRSDEIIRYGKGITGITKTADIRELYTAIRPYGKNNLTINGLNKTEYDTNKNVEYKTSGNNILAVQAKDRFPAMLTDYTTDRYVVMIWNYDTDNKNTLYSKALAKLKQICEPKVSYEVKGYVERNMWSRTVTVDGTGNKTYSPSQNGVCIAGATGNTGATGAAGKGVKSIVEQYYKSTSVTSLTGGSWSTTYPGWENGKYIWTRSVITYTDNTETTTTPVCVTGTKGDIGPQGPQGQTGAAGKDGQMLYATCDTAAGTVAKVATLASGTLSLKAGATVAVKFTYANTASSPTLNIAGTGAKAMYIQGVRDVYWTDGATVTFTYDGANWRVASEPVYAPTATIGNAAGFHVFIDGTSVQVRKGSEELAIFKGDEIRLGEGADCAKVFIGDLEIGVDGAETYLRNSSTRISTKSSHEGGSASVPSLVVDDKDTWINGRGMSSLVNFFPGNVHRMTAGTKVLTAGKTGTSRQLFSNSEINSLLGVSNSSNGNTAVMVSNGDGAATGVHVEGCTYQNGAWHTVFNTNIGSVPIRINYIITYWG